MRTSPSTERIKAEERWKLLSLHRLPARLSAEEVGWILGFSREEIGILVVKKILKPLGNPNPNGRKVFATVEILRLGESSVWLDKATRTVSQHWRNRNYGVSPDQQSGESTKNDES